jgi:hypothetical protein
MRSQYSPKEAVAEIVESNGERFILSKREGGGAIVRVTGIGLGGTAFGPIEYVCGRRK